MHETRFLPRNWPDLLKRYGLALGLACLALFLRGVLPFPEGAAIYQLPIAAVILSALSSGKESSTILWYLLYMPNRQGPSVSGMKKT